MRDRRTTLRSRAVRQDSTVAERALWDLLRAKRLNEWKFRRQSGVAGYVADFLCHEPKLVVELDGSVHDEPEQAAFDKRRDAEIEALGFTIIRIDERVVRERPQDALAWITFVGRRLLDGLPPYPDDEE
jgi:very-short-patch-repair endonuclease